jgi:hypothetical protein
MRRVFSTNDTFNYKDVYSLKNGIEILKSVKREDANAVLGRFKDYQQLRIVNNAYYPYLNNNVFEEVNINNLRDAIDSYVDFASTNSLEKGCIIRKKQVVPYSNQSSRLYLSQWNREKCMIPQNPFAQCSCNISPNKNCNCSNNTCSLCKNARPLFI